MSEAGWGNPQPYRLETVPGDCPVCHAANGNCVGDGTYDGHILFEKKKPDPSATFVIPVRIYEEIKGGRRTIRKLLYSPGDRVTPAKAKELGLLPS